MNPDQLRVDKDAVSFIRDFVEGGKPGAAICHGPWMLIEAGVVDGNLITSRSPDDLPVFCDTIVAKCASNSTQGEVLS